MLKTHKISMQMIVDLIVNLKFYKEKNLSFFLLESTSDDEDKITMDTNHKTTKNNNNNNESEQESEEEEGKQIAQSAKLENYVF